MPARARLTWPAGQPTPPGGPAPPPGALARELRAAAGVRQPSEICVIDPGHGGDVDAGRSTPHGARGPGGALEKHVTLRLAERVAHHLGRGARLTRDGDINLPLAERVAVARRAGARVFVSLHVNAEPGRGAEAFVHPRAGAASRALARSLHRALARFGGGPGGVRTAELAVLSPEHHAPATAACLLELDGLARPELERRLTDPAELDRLGRAIAGAIAAHHGAATALAGPDVDDAQLLAWDGPDGLPVAARAKGEELRLALPTSADAARGNELPLTDRKADAGRGDQLADLSDDQQALVRAIAANRDALQADADTWFARPGSYAGKYGYMYGGDKDNAKERPAAVPEREPADKNLARAHWWIWQELGHEGGATSIVTYDDTFSWGRGLSSVALVNKMAANFFADAAIADAFKRHGVAFRAGEGFRVVNPDTGHVEVEPHARELLKARKLLCAAFVKIGRDNRQALVDAQWAVIAGSTAKVPAWALAWPGRWIQYVAHLTHGWGALDWNVAANAKHYRDATDDIDLVTFCARAMLAVQIGGKQFFGISVPAHPPHPHCTIVSFKGIEGYYFRNVAGGFLRDTLRAHAGLPIFVAARSDLPELFAAGISATLYQAPGLSQAKGVDAYYAIEGSVDMVAVVAAYARHPHARLLDILRSHDARQLAALALAWTEQDAATRALFQAARVLLRGSAATTPEKQEALGDARTAGVAEDALRSLEKLLKIKPDRHAALDPGPQQDRLALDDEDTDAPAVLAGPSRRSVFTRRHGAPLVTPRAFHNWYTNFRIDGDQLEYLPLDYYSSKGDAAKANATRALLARVAGAAISADALRWISLGRPRPADVAEVAEFLHGAWSSLLAGPERGNFTDLASKGVAAEQLAAAETEPHVAQQLWIRKHLLIDCNGFVGHWLDENRAALRPGETDFSQTAPLDLLINTPKHRLRETLADVEPGDVMIYLGVSHVALIDTISVENETTARITQVQSWSEGALPGLHRGGATLTGLNASREAKWSQVYLKPRPDGAPPGPSQKYLKESSGLWFPAFSLVPDGFGDRDVAIATLL